MTMVTMLYIIKLVYYAKILHPSSKPYIPDTYKMCLFICDKLYKLKHYWFCFELQDIDIFASSRQCQIMFSSSKHYVDGTKNLSCCQKAY